VASNGEPSGREHVSLTSSSLTMTGGDSVSAAAAHRLALPMGGGRRLTGAAERDVRCQQAFARPYWRRHPKPGRRSTCRPY
jgi:hypothetical protein